MKCARCHIALPNEIRVCPKCGARQWRWLKFPLLWLATGALIAILLGPGSFSLGLIAWLLLALIAGLAPWREWLDFPLKAGDTTTDDGASRPASREPRRLSTLGLVAVQAASEGMRTWLGQQQTRLMDRLGMSARRMPQPVNGANGLLYVMSRDDIRAYDAISGDQRWCWTGRLVPGSPAISGDLVVARTVDALVALDSLSGEQRWIRPLAPAAPPPTLVAGDAIPSLGARTDEMRDFSPVVDGSAQARTRRRSAVRLLPAADAGIAVVLDKDIIVAITGEPKPVDDAVWYPIAYGPSEGWIIARNLQVVGS